MCIDHIYDTSKSHYDFKGYVLDFDNKSCVQEVSRDYLHQ